MMNYAEKIKQAPSMAQQIADTLRELILAGELEPGQYLRQDELARKFGVSRIPVRDALYILARQNLLVNDPRRGMKVRPISRDEIRDLYGLRRALETFAVREACKRLLPEHVSTLRQIIANQRAAMDLTSFIAADEEFHQTLCEFAGNKVLSESVADVWARIKQVRSVARADSKWGQDWSSRSIARHEQLVAVLSKCDANRAANEIDAIIHASHAELEQQLETLGWFEGELDSLASGRSRSS